jgi:hypothetical protein
MGASETDSVAGEVHASSLKSTTARLKLPHVCPWQVHLQLRPSVYDPYQVPLFQEKSIGHVAPAPYTH